MKAFDVTRKILLTGALLTFGASGMAQNTTPGTAAQYGTDQGWVMSFFSNDAANNLERWYLVEIRPGRSYCMETSLADFYDQRSDTTMYLYNSSTITAGNLIAQGDDYAVVGFTRGCFYNASSDLPGAYLNIRRFGNAPHAGAATAFSPGRAIRFRLTDTTVTAPWWFVNNTSGYNAFAEIANNYRNAVTITAKVLNSAGAVVGTTTRVLAGKGNIALSVASDFGTPITAGSGSIEVAHNGPVGAINLNVTSLSATQGLSFDSPGTRRTNW